MSKGFLMRCKYCLTSTSYSSKDREMIMEEMMPFDRIALLKLYIQISYTSCKWIALFKINFKQLPASKVLPHHPHCHHFSLLIFNFSGQFWRGRWQQCTMKKHEGCFSLQGHKFLLHFLWPPILKSLMFTSLCALLHFFPPRRLLEGLECG